ncbi:MAG: TIGR03032 family protein [Pirellulales bacterium]
MHALPAQDLPESAPTLQVLASRHFPQWLAESRLSVALTTYQTGKLFLVGLSAPDRLSVFERTFNRAMGLWSDGQTLWLAAAYQLWRFENALAPGELLDGYDRLFVPRVGYTTGDIDVHDVAVDADGRVQFISTLLSCLATTSERQNFEPLWRPPFVSKLAAEDRCHLNGLALRDGRSRYVTACSRTDVVDGWRDFRAQGGCLIDIATNEILTAELAMPHSPRWYRDRLWLLNSGCGEFGYFDLSSGRFEPVTFCPGYARGLAFHGNYAIVGLSRPREATFQGLPLDARLAERNAVARTGLQVIDLASGDVAHWLRIEGSMHELYDVVALPGVARPKALGFKTTEIRHNVWFDDDGQRRHWRGADRGGN